MENLDGGGILIKKKYVLEMDIMRCISILAVIFIHTSAIVLYRVPFNSMNFEIGIIINQLSRFSVPAFIFLSGMGLSIGYVKKNYFKFIITRISKIIPAYFFWCIVYVALTFKDIKLNEVVDKILFGQVFYHFYYIPLIIELYLIFPIVYKLINKKYFNIILFLSMICFTVYAYSHGLIDRNSGFFSKKNLFYWIFYFSLGVYCGKNVETFFKWVKKYKTAILSIFIVSIVILFYGIYLNKKITTNLDYISTFFRPAVIFYSLFFILSVFAVTWKNKVFIRVNKYISKISYDIYLCHALILYYYMNFYQRNISDVYSALFIVKAFLVTITLSIFVNIIKNLIFYLCNILSRKCISAVKYTYYVKN